VQPAKGPEPELSDDDLMRLVSGRDAGAFRLLVDRHGARPYRIAWRMLGNATDAEDVAQDALLRLWDQAGKWQSGQAGVSAWLARVATNLCLDRLRRRKFVSDELVPEREDETPSVDVQIDAERRRQRAAMAIAALPDRQRAAITLTYYEEFSNQMAADALGMNIKAFESLLLRARAALRVALDDFNGEGS
jgi:RNA polymerase sigma factor (sigma-70 family)